MAIPRLLTEVSLYLRLFLYLVLFNTVFISATVVLHEMGHYIYGTSVGCTGSITLYDARMTGPYTTLQCDTKPDPFLIYFSCFFLTVPFAVVFLLLRGFEERHFSLVVAGIAIISSAIDMQQITSSYLAEVLTIAAGSVVFMAGEYLVTDDMFKRFKGKIQQLHSGEKNADNTANRPGADS